jgi:hypothetical protein
MKCYTYSRCTSPLLCIYVHSYILYEHNNYHFHLLRYTFYFIIIKMSKIYSQFKIYNDIAHQNKNNPYVYFLLKNYAFKMVYSALGSNSQALNETEKAMFDRLQSEFQAEKTKNPNISLMSVDQYKAFLEDYFKPINFEAAGLDTMNACKALTEVLAIYGPMDELSKKRSNELFNI